MRFEISIPQSFSHTLTGKIHRGFSAMIILCYVRLKNKLKQNNYIALLQLFNFNA